MAEEVKPQPRRRYDTTRRQAQAAQTRQDIVAAAQRVLVGAAAADPELAEVWAQLENERLAGMGRFAQRLADRGVLRPGLSAEDARNVLWTLNSMAVHDLLVVQRGWPPERYRDWLAHTLAAALLPDQQSGGPAA